MRYYDREDGRDERPRAVDDAPDDARPVADGVPCARCDGTGEEEDERGGQVACRACGGRGWLREALREQERLWRSLPSGVDEEADPDDRSPEDVFAWTAGIAVRAIRAVLSKIYRCSGCGAYLSEKDVGPGGVGHAVTRYINGVPEPDLCGPCIEQKPEEE